MLGNHHLSSLDFLCLLHKCRLERNVVSAHHLHDVFKSQKDLPEALGNHLVSVLVELGSISSAQRVFDMLSSPDQCSWNALIISYVRTGQPHRALKLYMERGQVSSSFYPSSYAFVALLKACIALHDIESGMKLHTMISSTRLLERNAFVASSLVDMYAKCGSIEKAQETFDALLHRDTVTWTVLIAGYAEHGHGANALHYFDQMLLVGLSADSSTLVCCLKACGSLNLIDKGKEIHVYVAQKGLETELHVGNSLIYMYVNCGFLKTAQIVFEKLPLRDVISWNSLIVGYAENCFEEQALHCFGKMYTEGVCQDPITFMSALKACGTARDAKRGQEMHADITRRGFESELLISGTLINMYSKCGLLIEAREVFDKLLDRNPVLYNALVVGYVEHGHDMEALNCCEEMEHHNMPKSIITYVFCLKACANIGIAMVAKGWEIHSNITREGLERESLISSTLVDMYAKHDSLMEAQQVFDKILDRDVVTWTALMAGYTERGNDQKVLNCCEEMQQEGISLNAISYVCILRICGNMGYLDRGESKHADIARQGLEEEVLVGCSLVEMYAKFGLFREAQEVLYKLPVRNLLSWNAVMLGWCEHGHGEKTLDCYDRLQVEGISPNITTFVCILKASGNIGATLKLRRIHIDLSIKGLESEVLIGNTLIDTYAKCGMLMEAKAVFERLPCRDIVSWTTLIAGYAQLGESETVFKVFNKMIECEIEPNTVTLISILNACSHEGLLNEGQMYLTAIAHGFGVQPSVDHYTCIVDIFGRAGRIESAIAMIREMPLLPDVMVWQKILGACRKWGDIGVGRQAFEHVVRLDEKGSSAAYVCMSNLFAHASHEQEQEQEHENMHDAEFSPSQ